MMAILTQPNRSSALHSLRLPTLVVHGLADPMVHVSGGRATAAAIPGAELLLVDGMGHDLPPELYETLVDAITRTAARPEPGAGRGRRAGSGASVGDALPGLGVEDVHLARVGRHVDPVALLDRAAAR